MILVGLLWSAVCVCFCNQKTAYELRISDWSSDVCSSDLAALVGDFDRLAILVQGPTPSISDATEIYFCPASFAAITAARSSIVLRALSRRISIGRLTPAITSVRPASSRLIARFDGVPPNRSVSITTPRPSSTLRIEIGRAHV